MIRSWEVGEKVTTASSTVDLGETFSTKDMKLSFLCVDSKERRKRAMCFSGRIELPYARVSSQVLMESHI